MARPKSNRDEVLMELYMSGMSVQECADQMGYTYITTRNKLSTLGIYDPPLSETDPLWKEWDKTTKRLRRGNSEEGQEATVKRYCLHAWSTFDSDGSGRMITHCHDFARTDAGWAKLENKAREYVDAGYTVSARKSGKS